MPDHVACLPCRSEVGTRAWLRTSEIKARLGVDSQFSVDTIAEGKFKFKNFHSDKAITLPLLKIITIGQK